MGDGMASAKELREWEDRERCLKQSLKLAERYVERDRATLEKTIAYFADCVKALADHQAAAPKLTPRQAEQRKAKV